MKVLFKPVSAVIAFAFFLLPASAQPPILAENTDRTCSNADSLNLAIWSDDGIQRRQALKTLGSCGEEHWRLKILMTPFHNMDWSGHSRGEALINIFTALDPQAVAKPDRITEFLLAKAKSTDVEERRLALQGLSSLLETRFGVSSLMRSQQTLINGLADADPGVRQASADGFGGLLQFSHSENKLHLASILNPVVSALAIRITDPNPEVRATSIKAIANLYRLDMYDGLPQPVLSTDQLLHHLLPRLGDQSSLVRIEVAHALNRWLPSERLSVAQNDSIQKELLAGINNQEVGVAMAAVGGLDEKHIPDLVTRIRSGQLDPPVISALLSTSVNPATSGALSSNASWKSLVQDLASSSDLSLRINAKRALYASSLGQGDNHEQIDMSLTDFGKGIQSTSPIVQLDAIAGLSELPLRPQTISLLRPSLSSGLTPVRWAAALAIGSLAPTETISYPVLREILETSYAISPHEYATSYLQNSNLPEADQILAETAMAESRALYYIRSCSTTGVVLSSPKGPLIAVGAMKRSACRRALSEANFRVNTPKLDAIPALVRLLRADDIDLRFNAVYALGSMVYQSEGQATPKLSEGIVALLIPVANDNKEHPEVRRIAATMLHLGGHPMPSFFSTAGMPSPDSSCPYLHMGRGREPGFRFDPYEGRCMYDSRTGCGAGLPEVYSTLRHMLGQRNMQ